MNRDRKVKLQERTISFGHMRWSPELQEFVLLDTHWLHGLDSFVNLRYITLKGSKNYKNQDIEALLLDQNHQRDIFREAFKIQEDTEKDRISGPTDRGFTWCCGERACWWPYYSVVHCDKLNRSQAIISEIAELSRVMKTRYRRATQRALLDRDKDVLQHVCPDRFKRAVSMWCNAGDSRGSSATITPHRNGIADFNMQRGYTHYGRFNLAIDFLEELVLSL